jgi:hypothetical protein
MSRYRPECEASCYPELSRPITRREYSQAAAVTPDKSPNASKFWTAGWYAAWRGVTHAREPDL